MDKIDRIYLISSAGKRRLKSMRFRYISKSIFANCKGDSETFEYVNFRGSHFTKSSLKNAKFKGCDFWGTSFKKCKFSNAVFEDCVFQGCKFEDCDFTGTEIRYSAISCTNTADCKGISADATTIILNKYPEVKAPEVLLQTLEGMKSNKELRKTKVLWISDNKINHLNIYLLKRKYSDEQLVDYLNQLTSKEIKALTTYGSLSFGLRKFVKQVTI